MICKCEITDRNTISCPQCGAMPWQMPEMFLNEEQHQIWGEQVYSPQLKRWQMMKQKEEESISYIDQIKALIKDNNILNEKINALTKEIHSLTEEINILKGKKISNDTIKNAEQYVSSYITITMDKFEIVNGELIHYKGCAKDVYVPEGVIKIGEAAFYGCKSLQFINLPRGLEIIGSNAFGRCINLESITLPYGLKSIGNGVFMYCSSLKSITLPESMTQINNYLFSDCSNLESIAIPQNIKEIGCNVFDGCNNLKTIKVPKNLKIPNHKFPYNCQILRY